MVTDRNKHIPHVVHMQRKTTKVRFPANRSNTQSDIVEQPGFPSVQKLLVCPMNDRNWILWVGFKLFGGTASLLHNGESGGAPANGKWTPCMAIIQGLYKKNHEDKRPINRDTIICPWLHGVRTTQWNFGARIRLDWCAFRIPANIVGLALLVFLLYTSFIHCSEKAGQLTSIIISSYQGSAIDPYQIDASLKLGMLSSFKWNAIESMEQSRCNVRLRGPRISGLQTLDKSFTTLRLHEYTWGFRERDTSRNASREPWS